MPALYYLKNCLKNLLTLFLPVLSLCTACAQSVATTPASPIDQNPVPSSILVLGDSLGAAYGIGTADGWVKLLDRHLQQQNDLSTRYKVVNASISGETSGGALARLPALLDKYQPAIVIIELGANDGLRGYPIGTFRGNLQNLISLSRQGGAKVLLIGMHIPPNYGTRYTRLFYESYALAAQQFDIPLVPFLLEDIATHPELMQEDGLHPTAQAQPQILRNVLPLLEGLL